MSDDPNPTLARRRLAVRLRQARERNGRSLEDLAATLKVSPPQASRIDSGARGVNAQQLARLSDWYGLGRSERAELGELVDESRRRAWWQKVDLPDSYRTLIGLERGAKSINEYCGSVLPGLLQTPAYARAAVAASLSDITKDVIDRAVSVRLQRQDVLKRAPAPVLWVVIDEAALARSAGGAAVMSEQIDHLLSMAAAPWVTIQVIGFEAGIHIGTTSLHFIMLGLGQGVPDVLYTEGQIAPADTDDVEAIEVYRRKWELLRMKALPPEPSMERIARYV